MNQKMAEFLRRRLEEMIGLALITGGSVLAAAFAGWTPFEAINQQAGQLLFLFGLAGWGFVLIFVSCGGALLWHRPHVWRGWRWAAFLFAILGMSISLSLSTSPSSSRGGWIGQQARQQFREFFPQYADLIQTFAAPAVIAMMLVFITALPIGWRNILFHRKKTGSEGRNNLAPLLKNLQRSKPRNLSAQDASFYRQHIFSDMAENLKGKFLMMLAGLQKLRAQKKTNDFQTETYAIKTSSENVSPESASSDLPPPKNIQRRALPITKKRKHKISHKLPSLALIKAPHQKTRSRKYETAELAQQLNAVLQDFNIQGEILAINSGPVVTLFEFKPAPGIKSSRIIGLADDIARSMSALSARIAIIPGRNALGIEIPNPQRDDVHLAHLIASASYKNTDLNLPLVLGTTIGGAPIMADLAAMPHLLVAGTTGSGKSVSLNVMILSLLYHLHADECRMIMIDPKMLELSVYQDIPHLLAPVVTEPKKAVAALKWVVQEMEARYRKMSELNVRNIANYNQKTQNADEHMPFIVVVIDEMADLMMVAGKDIEAAVQRLAQMARAAGIHLIAATQRPSVDVITGTIKANFPTRISFQVASRFDSRTILGEGGAEQLLGRGDMLFMMAGGKVQRLHAPFVSDSHVERVAIFLRQNGPPPDYLEEITQNIEPESGFAAQGGGGDDDLYVQAINIVRQNGRASTSFLQRKLQIGYNRAARLIERLEEEGIVSPPNHAGKRQILNISGQ